MATTFHFVAETPPDSMFVEIQTLNKFNDEQFKQIISIVLTFLLEPSQSNQLVVHLDDFARDEGVSAAPLRNIVRSLITILNNAVKRNMTPSQLNEDLVNLGLTEEKSTHLANQWKSNLVGLSRAAVGQTLMVNQLVDMEWKFGVTAASSELQQVGSTFLQPQLPMQLLILRRLVNSDDDKPLLKKNLLPSSADLPSQQQCSTHKWI